MEMHYDFTELHNTMVGLLEDNISIASACETIKKELNRFFTDSTCKSVIYTINTDKPFFGIKVLPHINVDDDIYTMLTSDDEIRIDKYSVEIDSKIFTTINMNAHGALGLLIREIAGVVNDSQPIKMARDYLNSYLADNNSTLKMSNSVHYKEILGFGLKDFISKCNSVFYMEDPENCSANDFMHTYGFSYELGLALNAIKNANIKIYDGGSFNIFIVFAWALRLYRNVASRRVGALKTLANCKTLTGSKIEKAEFDNVMRRINRLDDEALLEAVGDKIKNRMKKMRKNSMRSFEDDYYEFNMRVRNVEDEDEALYIMRQINTRISLIEDYLNDTDCKEDVESFKKYTKLLDNFRSIRTKLSNSLVYKSKTYGIFVSYPEIREDNY